MANLKDIKRRITSVQSTQKITSAMKMVAAAKLRRAQEAIVNARPYAERMRSTLEEVAGGMGGNVEHPLFEVRAEVKSLELIIVTSDRGLAGAFNNAVIKVAQGAAQRFETGEVDEVILIYSEFITTMTQTPRSVQMLPVPAPEAAEDTEANPYEIEPSPEKLLAVLVPKAVEVEVFRALLESQAGEHAARMSAMESATQNTQELIEKLTLQYNRARQAAITSELVEIVTGAQALE